MKTLMKWVAVVLTSVGPLVALAQSDFPVRPIRLVVPFAPGGASDAVARPVAQAMSEILRQTVVVENKPGAAGNIALEMVARAPANGYVVFLGNTSTNAMNETSYADRLKVVPSRDLTAVGMISSTPLVLVASPILPAKDARGFVAYARGNPGKLNYFLPAIASGPHFDMLLLEKHLGLQMTAIPFSGGVGPALAALFGGQVDLGLINVTGAIPHINAGKLSALVVSSQRRLAELPDVPTAAEAGFGQLSSAWQGLFVPAATPKPVIEALHAALNQALSTPAVQLALARMVTEPIPSKTPDEAQAFIASETSRWGKIIRESGVRPE